jgi:hypothetical protein
MHSFSRSLLVPFLTICLSLSLGEQKSDCAVNCFAQRSKPRLREFRPVWQFGGASYDEASKNKKFGSRFESRNKSRQLVNEVTSFQLSSSLISAADHKWNSSKSQTCQQSPDKSRLRWYIWNSFMLSPVLGSILSRVHRGPHHRVSHRDKMLLYCPQTPTCSNQLNMNDITNSLMITWAFVRWPNSCNILVHHGVT